MANQNTPKIFCGSGKEIGQYGQISISVCISDLPNDYITTGKNGKKYINLKVTKKKEVDQWGKTHGVEVDTWKPEPRNAQPQNNWANSDAMEYNIPF